MATRRMIRDLEEALEVYCALELVDAPPDQLEIALAAVVCAHEELARPPLASPRVRFTQANLGGDRVSFWAHTRSQKE